MTTLTHRFTPRGGCAQAFEARDPEFLLSGPAGTGKSRALLERLHLLALLNPGMRGLIVRKTLASLGGTALVTWNQYVIPEAKLVGEVDWYGGSQQESAGYRYRNGSRISVGGMDKPTKIMSSEYDICYVQEAIELTETDWESISSRLRNGKISFQQIMADTNPDRPTHWLKARCDRGTCRVIESRHEDNPVLYDDDGTLTTRGQAYISRLDALTGVRHLRLRKGLWVAAEGQIYEDHDPAIHLVDRFDIPPTWPRHWAVDFGYTNPFVCQCWAVDPDGRLLLEWEVYRTKRLVEDHAATILDRVTAPNPDYRHPAGQPRLAHHGRTWTAPKPRTVVCDHDAEDRATLERHLGVGTTPAHKGVSDGIQAVGARLRPAGDGRPRLVMLRDALIERDPDLDETKRPTSTVEEIPGYVWDVGKDRPVKSDDHGMDAMRYMVAAMDLQARPRMRWIS